MKRLLFSELLLLSKSEKRARTIPFNRQATVVKGQNDTGKSSLIKSLYRTLGAEPSNLDPVWEQAGVIAALCFSIDAERFCMLRIGDHFSLFDANDLLVQSFDSVSRELGPFFATMFDFHLLLDGRSKNTQATPAFLFLPFYIDQDSGWTKQHVSFARLQQFSAPRKDMIDFHTGLRPSEFYRAKARLSDAKADTSTLQEQRNSLSATLERLETRLASVPFDTDILEYEKEISRLLIRCNELREYEEKRKTELNEAFNLKCTVDAQLGMVRSALHDLRQDRSFSSHKDDPVVCPICHAIYPNGFSERFEIALDEDMCIRLIADLSESQKQAAEGWESSRAKVTEVTGTLDEIQTLLASKRGEVALADVLRREGQKDVRQVFVADIEELDNKIGKANENANLARDDMRAFDDPERKAGILGFYARQLRRLLAKLDVSNVPENVFQRVDATITLSGSDLPRAILAYEFAILQTINEYSSSTFCPIVIDSPRQQDQDDKNWAAILECIRDEQPAGSQLILGTTSDLNVDFGGDVIDLTDKLHLLNDAEFESVNERLRPLIDQSLSV